ncbi:YceI family protein [Flavobacterium sp. N3904]|uniref:YceI family protein n=1 Tax=Flavobacterium sp. N3904 TaxID=2986835 RepID=UPI0022256358|nr:YceI family protein [Flavobacterium sp. N3904]
MKSFTLLFLILSISAIEAQEKLTTSKCIIHFEASVPLFEEVEAQNDAVSCVLIPDKSQITFVAIIKKFEFKRDLMKEHFNNNYMESDQYSKAIFKGIIEKFDLKDITETEKEYQIKGKIQIHGQTKLITVTARIKRVLDGIKIESHFNLNTDDFKIVIPSIVIAKVSKNVNTKIECILK